MSDDLDERLAALEARMTGLETRVQELREQLASEWSNTSLIVKWVIFPLIIILGGLVGIKVAWPGA